jgi:hypothetical protein
MYPITSFFRRFNPDFNVDSICAFCFRAAATSEREADLRQAEEEHVCFAVESQRRYVESQMGTF